MSRPNAESARGMFFDCPFCIRPDDERYTGPTVNDDGSPMAPWEVLEAYNQRRYEHLATFASTKALTDHLLDRAGWWTQGKGPEALAAAKLGIDSTVEMFERRREAEQARRRSEAHRQDSLVGASA